LRPGDTELTRALIRVGFYQAGYIHDCKGEFALDQLLRHDPSLR
jgi:hypothetical protein